MMKKNEQFLVNLWKDIIQTGEYEIKRLKNELDQTRNIPDACSGYVCDDHVKNENPKYKSDKIEMLSHQIGYWEGILNNARESLEIFEMNDKQFEKFQKQHEQLENWNSQMSDRLREVLEKKLNKDGKES